MSDTYELPSAPDGPSLARRVLSCGARWSVAGGQFLWYWVARFGHWLFTSRKRIDEPAGTESLVAAAAGLLALAAGAAYFVYQVVDTVKMKTGERWWKGTLAVALAVVVLFILRRFQPFFLRLLANLLIGAILVGDSLFVFALITQLRGLDAWTWGGVALAANLVAVFVLGTLEHVAGVRPFAAALPTAVAATSPDVPLTGQSRAVPPAGD